MGKISVFKFINNNTDVDASIIISDFLKNNGFSFNPERNCYTTMEPTKIDRARDIATSAVLTAASTLAGGGAMVVSSVQKALEYRIEGNIIYIKAYIINTKMNTVQPIHSAMNSSNAGIYYYNDLRNKLFKKLQDNNIIFSRVDYEKVNDGQGKKALFILIGTLAFIVLTFAIIFMILS